MSRLFLHIGQHKAGSSTLQAFLRDNRETLLALGYDYPEVGRGTTATHVAVAATVSKRRDEKLYRADGAHELAAHIRANPGTRFVVSAEAFETLTTREVRDLAEIFEGIATTIIIYVRNAPARVQSRYGQLAKNALVDVDFDQFFNNVHDNMAYFPIVERWAGVFGRDNVQIGVVDEFSPGTPGLLLDLLARIGITDPAGISLVQSGKNISPGWKTLEAIRSALTSSGTLLRTRGGGRPADEWQSVRRLTIAAVGAAAERAWPDDPKTNYLTRAQFEDMKSLYQADLAAINELLPERHRIYTLMPEYTRPRTFLPEYAAIPADERLMFEDALAEALRAHPATRLVTVTASDTAVYLQVPQEAQKVAEDIQPKEGKRERRAERVAAKAELSPEERERRRAERRAGRDRPGRREAAAGADPGAEAPAGDGAAADRPAVTEDRKRAKQGPEFEERRARKRAERKAARKAGRQTASE